MPKLRVPVPVVPASSRSLRRREKRAEYKRLQRVGRVRAPEFDMRVIIPNRAHLMARLTSDVERKIEDLATPLSVTGAENDKIATKLSAVHKAAQRIPSTPPAATALALEAAVARDAATLRLAIERAGDARPGVIARVAGECADGGRGGALEVLRAANALDDAVGLNAAVDSCVRALLRRGLLFQAMHAEQFSRILGASLRSGTYSMLARAAACSATDKKGGLRAVTLLVRTGATRKRPSAALFNAVLMGVLRNENGGPMPGRVLEGMRAAGVRPNGDSLNIVLRRARSVSEVNAVFAWAKGDEGPNLKAGYAAMFVRSYLRVGGEERDMAIRKCFSVVDEFYAKGIGVTKEALDAVIVQCAREDRLEAALTGWRELRRGWFGEPSRTARHALLKAVRREEVATGAVRSRAARIVRERLGQ